MKKKALPAAQARTGTPRLNKVPRKGAGKVSGRVERVTGKKRRRGDGETGRLGVLTIVERIEALGLRMKRDGKNRIVFEPGKKVPPELMVQMSQHSSEVFELWQQRQAAASGKPQKRAGVPDLSSKDEKRGKKPRKDERHLVAVVKKGKEVVAVWKPEMALPDGQQERFCRLMAMGAYSNYSCYAQAYPGSSLEAARSSSSDLLTKPNIRDRISWIREDSLKEVKIRIEESLRWYQTVRDTPVGYVDEESPLAQEVQKEIEGTEETGPILKVKVKIPSKMDAQRQIDKLMGFEKPQEVQVTMAYEPPSKALERALAKNLDLAGILAKAGLLGGRKGA